MQWNQTVFLDIFLTCVKSVEVDIEHNTTVFLHSLCQLLHSFFTRVEFSLDAIWFSYWNPSLHCSFCCCMCSVLFFHLDIILVRELFTHQGHNFSKIKKSSFIPWIQERRAFVVISAFSLDHKSHWMYFCPAFSAFSISFIIKNISLKNEWNFYDNTPGQKCF